MSKKQKALHRAIKTNDPAALTLAISNGADVNKRYHKLYPLEYVFHCRYKNFSSTTPSNEPDIQLDDPSIIRLLLENDVDLTKRSSNSDSYINIAIRFRDGIVVALLLSRDPNKKINVNIASNELQFVRRLRGGGFGIVYVARYQSKEVAVKKLHNQNPGLSDITDFTNEIAINASLKSPYIAEYLGASLEGINYSLVMEYLPNGTLDNFLESGISISWGHRYQLIMDIGLGLTYLHEMRILHCDLSSRNVVLDVNYRAKIIDFGLAKRIEFSHSAFSLNGAPHWTAPELLTPQSTPTPASDVYSFAMVMWEICSRKCPFLDLPIAQVMAVLKMGGESELIEKEKMLNAIEPGAPISFAHLIGKCWERRAENRPPIKQITQELQTQQSLFKLN